MEIFFCNNGYAISKKKSVAGVENEEVKQWIQDKDVLWQIQKHVSTFFAWQTNADLSVEVDDVVQEIVIRLLRNQSSFVWTKTQFKAWVARITRNMCIDFHRKQSKSSAMYVKPVDNKQRDTLYLTQLENTIDHSKNKWDIIEQDEMSIQLKWAIEQLPSEQRDVILLRHYADMPFNEIAKVMGVSINTALWRMRYALINLRRIPVIQQYFFWDCGHWLRLIQREWEWKERSTKKIIDTFIHQETSWEERNTYKQSTTKNTYVIHDLFYEDEVADTTNIFAWEEQEDIVMTQEMYYDVFEYLSTFDYLYLYSFYQRIAYDHLGEAWERYMSDFLDFWDTFIKSIWRSLLKKTTTGEYIRNKIQLWTQQPYDVAIKEFESLPLQYRKTCLEELKNTIISPTD